MTDVTEEFQVRRDTTGSVNLRLTWRVPAGADPVNWAPEKVIANLIDRIEENNMHYPVTVEQIDVEAISHRVYREAYAHGLEAWTGGPR